MNKVKRSIFVDGYCCIDQDWDNKYIEEVTKDHDNDGDFSSLSRADDNFTFIGGKAGIGQQRDDLEDGTCMGNPGHHKNDGENLNKHKIDSG